MCQANKDFGHFDLCGLPTSLDCSRQERALVSPFAPISSCSAATMQSLRCTSPIEQMPDVNGPEMRKFGDESVIAELQVAKIKHNWKASLENVQFDLCKLLKLLLSLRALIKGAF